MSTRSLAADSLTLSIPLTSNRTEDSSNKSYTTFLVNVVLGQTHWSVSHRFSRFLQLHQGLQDKFPRETFPSFPQRCLWHTRNDVEIRRTALEKYMQEIIKSEEILNSWDLDYFLQIKKHTGEKNNLKVLIPIPLKDFDPTEVAVPWKILSLEGFHITFATEDGAKGSADPLLVSQEKGILGKLAAEAEAKQFYKELEQDGDFCLPISWEQIVPTDYDGLLLPGGHASGMKPYLESAVLQQKIEQFWKLKRPVAAICHGVLLLSRCKDAQGKSLLAERKTTTLPKYMENLAYYLTNWKLGKIYRTYDIHCEDEVRQNLANPETQFQHGKLPLARGNAFDDQFAFVTEDANYISARWPGDAYLFAKKFVEKLRLYQKVRENEQEGNFEEFDGDTEELGEEH